LHSRNAGETVNMIVRIMFRNVFLYLDADVMPIIESIYISQLSRNPTTISVLIMLDNPPIQ